LLFHPLVNQTWPAYIPAGDAVKGEGPSRMQRKRLLPQYLPNIKTR
jgi:hypothetical protein